MADTTSPRSPVLSEANRSRRREILLAAERILQREGHASLTARRIAAEAGMSLGHITYNFSGMDEVVSETYRLISSRLRAASEAVMAGVEGDPLARLDAFLRAGFGEDFLDPQHLRLRVDFWARAMTSEAVARTDAALYDHYRRDLTGLLNDVAGENPARLARVPAIADTIMATLDGLWVDWMRRRDPVGIANGLDTTMAMVRALL